MNKISPKTGKWVERRLGDVADINPSESIPFGKDAKKVSMENLTTFCKRISGYSLEPFRGGTKFRNGDTLVARITPCLENGKTAFVDLLDQDEIGFGSTEFIVIREKHNLTDKEFLFYLATSPDFRDTAIKSMTGTSGRQRVETDEVEDYEFLLPPIDEQREIAETLRSLDEKIYILSQQNQILEEIGLILFKKWFVEEPSEDWIEESLDSVANFLNGLACQKYPPKNDANKLPVLKIKDLRNGFSDGSDWVTSEVDSKYLIDLGDVIFSWSGSLMIKIWDGQKCVLNQHLFKVTSNKYPKWFYYFWTKHHLEKFISIADSKATTMGHIKRGDLTSSMVLVPTNGDLDSMNKEMDPIVAKIILNLEQIKILGDLRRTLLPKLISGEIRLKRSYTHES